MKGNIILYKEVKEWERSFKTSEDHRSVQMKSLRKKAWERSGSELKIQKVI